MITLVSFLVYRDYRLLSNADQISNRAQSCAYLKKIVSFSVKEIILPLLMACNTVIRKCTSRHKTFFGVLWTPFIFDISILHVISNMYYFKRYILRCGCISITDRFPHSLNHIDPSVPCRRISSSMFLMCWYLCNARNRPGSNPQKSHCFLLLL